MRILVTGARGRMGSTAVHALLEAGHAVRSTDIARGPFAPSPDDGESAHWQADLTDAGDAYAVVRGCDAVVHAAAIPSPTRNAPHTVFHNNLMATFNVVEAAVRWGAHRLVNISSESVTGLVFAERPWAPRYVPIDEDHPVRPQDPYALAKHFGEQICAAAVRRSDLRCVSLRPSWVQYDDTYERDLGPVVRAPSAPSPNLHSYVDGRDVAETIVRAITCDIDGHEAMFVAAPDNATGRPLADLVRTAYGDAVEVRDLPRVDASATSSARLRRVLGWAPSRSWRDHLDGDGRRRHR